jgi:thymidylate synthase
MKYFEGRNVNDLYPRALKAILEEGIRQPSRYGDTLEFERPVTSGYRNPCERVLFDPVRDANPFFHLHECLWMMAGRRDVAPLAEFNSRMGEFSDDGETYNGAYGFRWRYQAGFDQLPILVDLLKKDPDTRRAVLQMWSAYPDLITDKVYGKMSKDLPCNMLVCFKIRKGALNMTVYNRSNDLVWGCYGANAVHFSFLQEYMAGMIGVPVGTYYQVSDSLHVYTNVIDSGKAGGSFNACPYAMGMVNPYPIMDRPEHWLDDCSVYMREAATQGVPYRNSFFIEVAEPMRTAFRLFKRKEYELARTVTSTVCASDWRLAAVRWLDRRAERRSLKQEANL